jgi:hypothetical protein
MLHIAAPVPIGSVTCRHMPDGISAAQGKHMRRFAKGLRIFNSLAAISILVLIAMVLTTLSGSASPARDPLPEAQGFALFPPVSPDADDAANQAPPPYD